MGFGESERGHRKIDVEWQLKRTWRSSQFHKANCSKCFLVDRVGSATRSRVLERDSERERERARERASKRAREREREREKRELSREGLGFKVLGLGLGFRVWGLGVGVSGLGFGGWGSGFGRERVSERLSVSVPVISLRHKPVFFFLVAPRALRARGASFFII